MKPTVSVIWLRRDLRLEDNAALFHALTSGHPVLPLFIFDRNILDNLEDKSDRRVTFIYQAIETIQQQLTTLGSSLEAYYGFPEEIFTTVLVQYNVAGVYANADYEQYAIDRDQAVSSLLELHGSAFHSFKDQVIFDKDEVMKDDGKPYTIFTPYSKKWKSRLNDFFIRSYRSMDHFGNFYKQLPKAIPSLPSMGFTKVNDVFPSTIVSDELIKSYHLQRDFPSSNATSRLSVHLRFGTISIRELTRKASSLSDSFLNELIWRDFYHMILWNIPHVRKGFACKPQYDRVEWRNNEAEFDAWCNGKTGYPIVDAGMRELNTTGFMHNRVRMITASFLCKHLLIDWRWGEAYFASKLLDYDFAANNGGWQWSSGSGCDAAPYFRIFNPTTQAKKFDKDFLYTRKWVPELDTFEYPQPIVDHEFARARCLQVYKAALKP
jgi:deoxyribodipyrimidine photo-lyase